MTLTSNYQNGMKSFLVMQNGIFQSFLAALETEPPSLNLSKLAQSVTQAFQKIDDVDLLYVITILNSFYEFRSNRKLDNDEVIQQITKGCFDDESLAELFDDKSKILFRERLFAVLNSENSISLAYKILDVTRNQERLFLESRILTDIRTIFKSDLIEPLGAAITQVLKIEYLESNQRKEFFVALEPEDIEQLYNQLNRARQKADSLKFMLKNANISYLDITSNE